MEVWDGVSVADGALVPVVGDLLPAFGPFEVARGAGDGEERLEDFFGLGCPRTGVSWVVGWEDQPQVQTYFGVFGRFVGNEAINEGISGGLHGYIGKWTVEEVRVVVDALIEPVRPEICKNIEVIVCCGWIWLGIEGILPLRHDKFVIVAATNVRRHLYE